MSIRTIYFDTETTGLNCHSCKVIELAMLIFDDGTIVEEYDEFINVEERLSPKIVKLTGITDSMLTDDGISEESVAEDLKRWLTPGSLMIAHNAQFDLSFIYMLLKRHFPEEADGIVENLDWLDTLTVLKDRKDYPHKLIDAVNHYNIEKVNFHRAIDDTKALYQLTQKLNEERSDLDNYCNLFGFNPKWGISGVKFDFINYKSQPYHNQGLLPEFKTLPNRVR